MKNHTRNSKRSLSKLIFSLNDDSSLLKDHPILGTTPEDTSEIALQVISPSKKKRALLRKLGSDKADGFSRYVEIWNDGVLEASLDVSDLHGDFYSDGKLLFNRYLYRDLCLYQSILDHWRLLPLNWH